jgi:hypothetical protein
MTRPSSAKKIAYGNRRVSARRTPLITSTKEAGLSAMLAMASPTATLNVSATCGDLLRYQARAFDSSARAPGRMMTRRINRLRKPHVPPIPTIRLSPATLGALRVSSEVPARARQRREEAPGHREWSPRSLRPVEAAPARSTCESRRCPSRDKCTPASQMGSHREGRELICGQDNSD